LAAYGGRIQADYWARGDLIICREFYLSKSWSPYLQCCKYSRLSADRGLEILRRSNWLVECKRRSWSSFHLLPSRVNSRGLVMKQMLAAIDRIGGFVSIVGLIGQCNGEAPRFVSLSGWSRCLTNCPAIQPRFGGQFTRGITYLLFPREGGSPGADIIR